MMLKLWMVIFIAGRIHVVWADPMPSDMTLADCQIKVSRWTARTAPTLDPVDQPVYACVERAFRPRRGDAAAPAKVEHFSP